VPSGELREREHSTLRAGVFQGFDPFLATLYQIS